MTERGDTKISICDSCEFGDVEVMYYEETGWPGGDRDRWLCDLCAGTYTSRMNDSSPEGRILLSLCYIGNTILKAVRDSQTTRAP